ncbi:MAG: hypothetical protein PVG61_02555 [Dehalococcoidia bacterium]
MGDFKIGDKVKVIKYLDEYNGKTGTIIMNAGKQPLPGFRKPYEGFKGEGEQQHWLVNLDDTNETIEVPEVNLEKIS